MEDRELVKRLKKQDVRALEVVIYRYTAYVLTIIRRVGVPPLTEADAEELASDTFAALWRTADTIRDPSALKPYLGKIARNLTVSKRRKHKQELSFEEELVQATDGALESLVTLREQTAIVNGTLETMEQIRRSCLIRRYFYGQSLADISQALDLPLSTVKTHIYRGRKQLIEALKKRGYGYEDAFIDGV